MKIRKRGKYEGTEKADPGAVDGADGEPDAGGG